MNDHLPEDLDDRLRAYLATRALQPGDRLPAERTLAQRLGVSRPTLRHALRRLADDGVIEIRQRSGAYLTGLDLADLLAVRMRLEPFAAALAAEAATDRHRRLLRDALRDAAAHIDEVDAFARADIAVHDIVADVCGNRVLADVLASLRRAAGYSRRATSGDPALRRRTLTQLTGLVGAIIDGNPAAAEQAMAVHLGDVGAALPGTPPQRRPESPSRARHRAVQ
ncbi:FCD domain-containing protein [Micromonospora sp. NPDC050686]|uniref:FadR/GntR family transcriptional regulator n=1 Tax=Micromonospora sp. NPDC050686 TaxID=3154631 RepID=UPI0033EF7006